MTILQQNKIKKLQSEVEKYQGQIKEFCTKCVGDVISDVKNCTAKKCSLYKLRPYK